MLTVGEQKKIQAILEGGNIELVLALLDGKMSPQDFIEQQYPDACAYWMLSYRYLIGNNRINFPIWKQVWNIVANYSYINSQYHLSLSGMAGDGIALEAIIYRCAALIDHLDWVSEDHGERHYRLVAAMTRLQTLRFTKAGYWTIPDVYIQCLRQLYSVSFKNNRLIQLPSSLHYWTKLSHLNLTRNALTAAVLLPLRQLPLLKQLNLSKNPLKACPAWLWEKVSGTLRIERTALNEGQIEWGDGNNTLSNLYLSHNRISQLPNLAHHFPRLRRLVARHLGLQSFREPWTRWRSLEYLDVSHNQLSTFKIAKEVNFPFLRTLNLSANQFHAFAITLRRFYNVQQLIIAHNRLREFNLDSKGLNTLSKLILSHNKLRCVTLHYEELPELDYLDLSHNPLKELPSIVKEWATAEQGAFRLILDRKWWESQSLPTYLTDPIIQAQSRLVIYDHPNTYRQKQLWPVTVDAE